MGWEIVKVGFNLVRGGHKRVPWLPKSDKSGHCTQVIPWTSENQSGYHHANVLPRLNVDRQLSQSGTGNPLNLFKIHPAEDSRRSLTRIRSMCTRLSLEKWRLEKGWILCRIDG